MNATAIKGLHYERYLKILSLKEFSDITSGVNPYARGFLRLLIYYMTEKITNARALICTPVQIKN